MMKPTNKQSVQSERPSPEAIRLSKEIRVLKKAIDLMKSREPTPEKK